MVVSHEAKKAQSTHPMKKMRPLLWVIYMTEHFHKITSYFRHKTFVLVLHTTQSFRAVCAIACWSSWHHPHSIMNFLKSDFGFHFFSSSSQPIWQPYSYQRTCTTKYWLYRGLLVQCTSTVKITKNHLLVYEITFVAFELRFRHDCILFLVDGRCSKLVYHLMNMSKGRWLHKIVW